jgi:hypothetical protein
MLVSLDSVSGEIHPYLLFSLFSYLLRRFPSLTHRGIEFRINWWVWLDATIRRWGIWTFHSDVTIVHVFAVPLFFFFCLLTFYLSWHRHSFSAIKLCSLTFWHSTSFSFFRSLFQFLTVWPAAPGIANICCLFLPWLLFLCSCLSFFSLLDEHTPFFFISHLIYDRFFLNYAPVLSSHIICQHTAGQKRQAMINSCREVKKSRRRNVRKKKTNYVKASQDGQLEFRFD